MAASLRLTLRTLLSYLDDTLDPAQAKVIGQKVAESEQARELMDRIRQVTRRRRLTAPPAAGPGGIDGNTIAEYLDNEVTPEQAEEVERICLASDVHLAEVAACHQILTLVLGEPALVPPSARQRMYGLVKGPEAIPFRKPPKASHKADLDLSTSDAGLEVDDTLRIPAFIRRSGTRNSLLLAGGGLIAACLLVIALWQLFRTSPRDTEEQPNQGPVAVVGTLKDPKEGKADNKPADKPKATDDKPAPEPKQPTDDKPPPPKKIPDDKKSPVEPKAPDEAKPASTEIVTGQEEIPLTAPLLKPVVLGQYEPNVKSPDTLLQKDTGAKGNWVRLWGKNVDIVSARPLVSLPGNRGSIQLKSGIHLTLWGTMPEIYPNPYLFESMVELYPHPVLALDMKLRRGRIVLKNTRTDNKPAMVRIRFENPLKKADEAFTLALMEKDATAVIERAAFFPLDETFFEDPNNANRLGPQVYLASLLIDGTGYLRWTDTLDYLDARAKPQLVLWNNREAKVPGPEKVEMPDWLQPMPKAGDPRLRAQAIQAAELLAKNLREKQLDVALSEALLNTEAPMTQKLALLSSSALDDFSIPLEMLEKEETRPDLRRTAVYTLRHWIAQNPANEYQLYERLTNSYKKVVARKLMERLHGISQQDHALPATWQGLIDDLNNSVLPLRELSAWNLEMAVQVPEAQKLAASYSANAPENVRVAIQTAWRTIIPPGRLPPAPGAPPLKK